MGNNKQNVIELNGKRYDAKTGSQLATPSTQTPKSSPSIDGIINKTPKIAKPHPKVPAKQVHHRLAKSSTLVRKAVRKPTVKKSFSLNPSRVSDPSRVNRAQAMSQSKLIKHFNMSDVGTGIKKAASLPVKAAPSLHSPINMSKWPVAVTATRQISRLQNSLDKSTSHEQPKIKKTKIHHRAAKKLHLKTRTLNIAILIIVALGIGGFFAYQNIPGLTLRLASARAGIHATLPTYQPAGFSLNGPVSYSTGQVKIGYKSNTDDRRYNITQTASAWDSQALLQNFIVANHYNYQTFQDNGKTIYIYDNSNATWVDGGVLYQVLGNSVLSSDQLVSIASSI